MEKFLFKAVRVELWLILLVAVLGIVGLTVFGAMVRVDAQGYKTFGRAGQIAGAVASFPTLMKNVMTPQQGLVAYGGQRFAKNPGGWNVTEGAAPIDAYILLSRFDGDTDRHVVELFDPVAQKTVFQWRPDADTLMQGVDPNPKHKQPVDLGNNRFRVIHPLLTDDGGLIIKDHGAPLARVDACSRKVWLQDSQLFHHSTEPADDGSFWTPSHIEPVVAKGVLPEYFDDGLAHIAADGTILANISATQALMDNGYRYLIFRTGPAYKDHVHIDRIHVNDIQPVLADGPHWKKGDLFVSMRHISALMLYRPSTNRIIWLREGPWSAQHDVDIVDDHTIAVFNNNVLDMGKGAQVYKTNNIVYYNFDTDQTSTPFDALFKGQDIKTMSEGSFTLLPGGDVMVEEENFGRLLVGRADGSIKASFINRASNGKVYRLGWSRAIDRDRGDRIAKVLAGVSCG